MKTVPVTQYMRPDGRPVQRLFPAVEFGHLADRVLERGYRFECEVLTTGEVSLTLFDRKHGEDVLVEVVPNGPEIAVAFEKLVRDAHKHYVEGTDEDE